MPLTEYQESLARLLAQNRSFDSYLAGGAAILIEPNTVRYSRDLDYFHDSEARVAEAHDADRRLLEKNGFSVAVELNQPGYVRAVIRKAADAIGCLYYSPSRQAFVDPRTVEDAVPHYGRPGGVAPRIASDSRAR